MSSPVAENEVVAAAAAPAADADAITYAEAKRPIIIPLRPGFNCTVRTNSNTGFYSKVPVKLVDEMGGREIAKATFVGRASPATNVIDVPLRIQSSGAYEWTIKAAAQKRSVNVDITHSKVEKGPFEPSKIAKPIEIQKRPEDGKIHQEFYYTIILSENWTNNTWDDAIVTIVQWK